MAAEKEITPEEKLLKVIQSGGAAKADAAQGDKMAGSASGHAPSPPKAQQPAAGQQTGPAQPKPAGPAVKPAPAAAPVRAAAQKPPADQTASPASAAHGKQEAPSGQKPAAAKDRGKEQKPATEPALAAQEKGPHAAAPKKLHGSAVSMLPTVNRALGALAAALVALTAWQIWGMIRSSAGNGLDRTATGAGPAAGAGGPELAAPGEEFDVEKIVAAYLDRNIFKYSDTGQPQQGNVQAVAATNVSVQASELAARLKLMGFTRGDGAEAEVILWDQQQSRMHIVRKGGKIIVGEKPLELVDVERESVVLSDGRERLTVR